MTTPDPTTQGASSRPTVPATPPEVSAAPVESRLGRYVRTVQLGAGGFGEVWKAWDTELCRWVALKVLKNHGPADLARFQREALTAANLNHPNIAAVFEAKDDYIAMQFVDGRTLHGMPRTDLRVLADIVRQAALAVHAAHERGIVHRDLKPANIMLENRTNRVYVMDFGLAKQTSVASSLSGAGMAVGTPSYMPPEQAAARVEEVGPESDVYSLGATLYELVTGRPPFDGPTLLDVLMQVIDTDPVPPQRLNPRVDADLATILLTCLEKDRTRRYRTAAALADDLGRWIAGEPITAHRPSIVYRLRKRLAKRKAITFSAALVALLALAVAVVVPRWLDARAAAKAEEARRKAVELYVPLEASLNELRMKFYIRGYTLAGEFPRYDDLMGRIRAAMEQSGPCAQAHYLIGRCRELLADAPGADAAYAAAMEIDPGHAPTLLARGRLAVQLALRRRITLGERQDAREAVEWIRRGLAASGKTRLMEADLAEAYLRTMETFEAGSYAASDHLAAWRGEPFAEEFRLVEALTRGDTAMDRAATAAIENIPSWPLAWFWRSAARQKLGRVDDALADSDEALRINPRFPEALLNRGGLRQRRGDHAGAKDDYDALIALEPSFAEAWSNRADAKLASGDSAGAIADATEAIRLNASLIEPILTRGNARLARGEWDAALADYALGLTVRRDARFHLQSGRARRAKGDLDGACDAFTQALSVDARCAEALADRALVHESRRDWKAALADYEDALRIRPRFPEALANRGGLHQVMGNLDASIDDLREAIAINPRMMPAHLNLCRAHFLKHDYAAARAAAGEALRLDPGSAKALAFRAEAAAAAGDLAAAIEDWTEVLRLDGRNSRAFNSRGNCRRLMRDPGGAVADFDEAIRLDPKSLEARFNRALVNGGRGRPHEALKDLDEVVRLNPDLVDPWFYRAIAKIQTGDDAGARSDLEHVLKIAPADWSWRERAQAELEDLKRK